MRTDRTDTWPTQAVAWGSWGVACVFCVRASPSWWFGVGVLLAVVLTWRLLPDRSAAGRPGTGGLASAVTGLVSVLAAVWFLIGLGLRRDGAAGDVLWVLPGWDFVSGGSFGGAVTLGQLEAAAGDAVRAVALVAALGLLYRAVPASGLVRLAELVLGSGSAVVAPIAFMGQAVDEQEAERTTVRRLGIGGAGPRLRDLWQRAVAHARDWTATDRPRSARVENVRLVAAVLVAGAVLVLAVTQRSVDGPVLMLGAVAALVGVGTALTRPRLDPMTGGGLAALASAAMSFACWWWRPGESYAVIAVLALPALVLLAAERAR